MDFIEVAVALPVTATYSYAVPAPMRDALQVGQQIIVPFGQRQITGYVLGRAQNDRQQDIKPVAAVLDDSPLFPAGMVPFFRWIAEYYFYPLGQVIKEALPAGLSVHDVMRYAITEEGQKALQENLPGPKALSVLAYLQKSPCRPSGLQDAFAGQNVNGTLSSLERRGWVCRQRQLTRARIRPKRERFVARRNANLPTAALSDVQQQILQVLASHPELSIKALNALVPAASRRLKPLERAGYLTTYTQRVHRDPFGEPITRDQPLVLTAEQAQVMQTLQSKAGNGYDCFLLTGVTGSGKTEIYLQMAAEMVGNGLSVLVLVPEIALIAQIERRFRARFGERVAILHSGLSPGERYDQWEHILTGKASIVVGARSAIFAPLADIGIIIVDEEHDSSYKQDVHLHYNARDLALVRAKMAGGLALLGSATPSIQSTFNLQQGKFKGVALTRRVADRPLPKIQVVDLRDLRDQRGLRRFISSELKAAMGDTLRKGKQALLFLNRRGYASFPVCAACGETIRCPHCDISLTLHRAVNAYKCHYCGFSRAASSQCVACGTSQVKMLGLGTEKLEAVIQTLFPDARIGRMDRDTTARKGALLKLLKALQHHEIDIMVGTQMLAKGHDFPDITLVGIICADLSLNFPDFRAGERTFQLLAQVAGRAGRGGSPGRVILQTYNPQHFIIQSAQSQDFKSFYAHEIEHRRTLSYPPFARLVQIKLAGRDQSKTRRQAQRLCQACRAIGRRRDLAAAGIEIWGPVEAPLARIADRFRWQILLKSRRVNPLHRMIHCLVIDHHRLLNHRSIKVAIDVDPLFMM